MQKQLLTQTASNLERFFAANGTYSPRCWQIWAWMKASLTRATIQGDRAPPEPTGIGSSYVITAKAVPGTMQAKDTGCTALQINSLGVQLPDPATSDCW